MKQPEVKICGTVTEADLEIAVNAGADAIGIICSSKRPNRHTVTPDQAVRLAAAVPKGVTAVLIPRLTEAEAIIQLTRLVKPDRLQLGEIEDFEILKTVAAADVVPEIAQVIHVNDRSAIARAEQFAELADIIHLDSAGDRPGGTGQTHDWNISQEITNGIHALGGPVILAGGLTPENVSEAITTVRPDGVDVETGIKGDDRAHDSERVRGFITTARAAFERSGVIK